MKNARTLVLVALLLSLVCIALAACQTNAVTGKNEFNVLSTSQEISLGKESSPEFLKEYGGEVKSPEVLAFVNDLGKRLAAKSERQGIPWEFHMVDSAVINAFALPGGKVFISRELASKLTSEAQMAGVLGHEVGHVSAQHIGKQMSQQLVISGIVAGLGIVSERSDKDWLQALGVGAELGGTVYILKFGRDQETQADELGLHYMSQVGYKPAAMLQVMQILKDASAGGRSPEFLSTHPYPETRMDNINRLLREKYSSDPNTSRWVDNSSQYKAAVLDRLAKLPPPAHDPEKIYSKPK